MKKIFFVVLFILIFPFASFEKNLRIISISPAVTEILCFLGVEDFLVGVTTSCNYPKRIKNKPKIGDFIHPNLEKILVLKPDLVIGMGNSKAPAVKKLKDLGIDTMILDSPSNIQEIIRLIKSIADKVGCENIQNILKLESLYKVYLLKKYKKIKTLMIIWDYPLMVVGKNTFLNEMLELAGGKNVWNISDMQFPVANIEQIIKLNPEVIIVADKKIFNSIKNNKLLHLTKAGKDKHIYKLSNEDLVLRPGPRIFQGINELKQIFSKVNN